MYPGGGERGGVRSPVGIGQRICMIWPKVMGIGVGSRVSESELAAEDVISVVAVAGSGGWLAGQSGSKFWLRVPISLSQLIWISAKHWIV